MHNLKVSAVYHWRTESAQQCTANFIIINLLIIWKIAIIFKLEDLWLSAGWITNFNKTALKICIVI